MDRFDDTVDNDTIIDRIVSLEWDMFQAVNKGGPRASCQDDRATFEGMRRGQFEAWSAAACRSYLDDLLNAALGGRNLVTEKYIHMMKYTFPAQYDELIKRIPVPDEQVVKLAGEITDKLLEQTAVLFKHYPRVTGLGRPLRSVSDFSGVTSIETYQLSELLTYSVKTLRLLKDHLIALEKDGKQLARVIYENSVKHYGYKTLDEAEASIKTRMDQKGAVISSGCDADSRTRRSADRQSAPAAADL
ncbi:MAG: DUF4125 family protein [Clostridiales bacterium]|jgi:hypothetical protein|nr:DUF4125 family protein [Clostridiales bacterium]